MRVQADPPAFPARHQPGGPNRRHLLAGLLCGVGALAGFTGGSFARSPFADGEDAIQAAFAGAQPAGAADILFVGNSFTREHDLPGIVADTLGALWQSERTPRVAMIAVNGHWLADHRADGVAERVLAAHRWDLVVLQDHSTTALTPDGALRGAEAAAALARAAGGARLVFSATWARRAGHPLYRKPGMPAGPDEMAALAAAHAQALAERHGGTVAHLGHAFAEARRAGAEPLAADGHHASPAGAVVAADVLARTIDAVLSTSAARASTPG